MNGGADGREGNKHEARDRQPCPRCKDDMMRMYRQKRGADEWDDVWFCLSCRREVVIHDEG